MPDVTLPAIIVHGGAGLIDAERAGRCVDGCERAARAGLAVLERGGAALDAVEEAVRVLEEDPEFNAGRGACLNRDGTIEVDAAVMTGDLRVGAVGALPWTRHPVSVARRLLERGPHCFLVGAGAASFARELGILPEPPEALITERARARWEQEREAVGATGDTVGACAVDGHGRLACATSTGGIAGKRAGRVGDSPLPGAGTYADDERGGAASATGHGESILRVLMAREAVDRIAAGEAPEAAAAHAVEVLGRRAGAAGRGGIIVLGRDGRFGQARNTARMPWAAAAPARLVSGW
jgi:beta-aspartyl-peptidase (threonine type)